MKFFLLIVLSTTFFIQSKAQIFQWAQQYESRYSLGKDAVTDNNLNVISCGWFHDSVDLDPGPGIHKVYESDLGNSSYLSKLNDTGAMVWGFSYEGSGNGGFARIADIDVDNQDNIIVMGYFRDSIDLDFGPGVYMLHDSILNTNNDNVFIAKYDPLGGLLWGKCFSSTHANYNYGIWGLGIKVDGANNILFTGRFRDTVDFDPGAGTQHLVSNFVNSTNYGDEFLLKLSGAGNFTWVRQWRNTGTWLNNSNGWYGSNEIQVDANNNIFFPLNFMDSIDIDPGIPSTMIYSQGGHDVSLLKVSSAGNLVWHKEIGGSSEDHCHALAIDPTGNIFYTIQSYSSPLDMDPGPNTFLVTWQSNVWTKIILKLDNTGNFLWALKNLDNNNNSNIWADGIAADTSGGIYLTTMLHPNSLNNNQWDLNPGIDSTIVNGAGSSDIAIQNFDGSGQFLWGGIIGGSAQDLSYGISTDNSNGIYVSGYFINTADFDPTANTHFMTSAPTIYDAYLIKLKSCHQSITQLYQGCDSVLYDSQYYYSDTSFQANYTGEHGCDSIVSTNIVVQNGSDFTINMSTCDTTTINSVTYYTPGTYYQTHTNVNGCDSILTIHITPLALNSTISYSGTTGIISNATNVNYQWMDCATSLIIPGETNALFTPSQSGSYACIITKSGCSDTSACFDFTANPNGLNETLLQSHLYPNPSKGSYHLELDKEYKNVQLEIRSMSGQLVWKQDYKQLKETNISIDKATGVYMLYIKQGERTQVKKLLKW